MSVTRMKLTTTGLVSWMALLRRNRAQIPDTETIVGMVFSYSDVLVYLPSSETVRIPAQLARLMEATWAETTVQYNTA